MNPLGKQFIKAAKQATEVAVSEIEIKGRVMVAKLNVRKKPKLGSQVLGIVRRDDILNILNELPEWYEIKIGDQTAYVYKKYVKIFAYIKRGEITVRALNIRSMPSLESNIVGRLKEGDIVFIVDELPQWYGIDYKGHVAYVYKEYVLAHDLPALGGLDAYNKFFYQRKDLFDYPLEPDKKLTLPTGRSKQRTAAQTWNRFGGLMSKISQELAIEVEAAMSVLCVESGGSGFSRNGKMIIRFENHVFWMFWGKFYPDEFNKYFKFNRSKTRYGHMWRSDTKEDWQQVHESQTSEWKAFEFAKSLNEEAALKSISMGAPQIMGFNYKVIGYKSVNEMFDNFNKDIRFHLFALFDFAKAKPRRIRYLQDKDFFSFAREYNGTGAPRQYEQRILEFYHIFKKLI